MLSEMETVPLVHILLSRQAKSAIRALSFFSFLLTTFLLWRVEVGLCDMLVGDGGWVTCGVNTATAC